MRSPKVEGDLPLKSKRRKDTNCKVVRWKVPPARRSRAGAPVRAPAMAQDGRLVAHLHRIPALVDLIDEDWRHEHLSHDDFDLPSVDFDEESDDVRTQPKRKAEEKWAELCLDEFQ